jgi:hypothetical protein
VTVKKRFTLKEDQNMETRPSNELIWAVLLHLGYNMWSDRDAPEWGLDYVSARPYLRFDESLWDDLLQEMARAGINMVVIDLGEGVQYESHPELAVRGSWTKQRLLQALDKVRALGIEPIPKLNFSTSHDAWLGEYARCVSTDVYYAVCRDLIAEVVELFDTPRFFHLGMDEETARHQRHYDYALIRQHDLWWHDLLFYVEQVERGGVRPWIWSDYVWHHPEAFFAQMPKSVLQSNWYYGEEFGPDVERVKAYDEIEAHGYDQIPTGSNWTNRINFKGTVDYCREHLAQERLYGFLQTVWKPTLEECRDRHLEAIDLVKEAKMAWVSRS